MIYTKPLGVILNESQRDNIISWVKALRSGNYIQGKKMISPLEPFGFSYDAIGVLSESLGLTPDPMCRGYYLDDSDYLSIVTLPRDYFLRKVGFSYEALTECGYGLCGMDFNLNLDFNGIADAIEASVLLGIRKLITPNQIRNEHWNRR